MVGSVLSWNGAGRLVPALVLIVGCGLSFLAYRQAEHADRDRVRGALEVRAEFRAGQLNDRLHDATVSAESLATFFSTQKEVVPDEFQGFAKAARGDDPVTSLGWAVLIQDKDRAVFEALARTDASVAQPFEISDLDAKGHLAPATARDAYLVIRRQQRFDDQPSTTGLDLLALPGVAGTLDQARDSGEGVAAVYVPPGGDPRVPTGFAVLWPAYGPFAAPRSVAERRAALMGVVVATYRLDQVMDFAMQGSQRALGRISLFVDRPAGDILATPSVVWLPEANKARIGTETLGPPEPGGMRLTRTFECLGRNWTLVNDFDAGRIASLGSGAQWGYLALGLALTLLLAWFAAREQGRRRAVEALVAERTRELTESRIFLDLVIKNIPEWVYLKDAKSLRFVWAGPTSKRHAGFEAAQLVGKNDHDLHDRMLADEFTAVERGVLEAREMKVFPDQHYVDADGRQRIVRTKKIPVLDDRGEPIYLLGLAEDVAEERRHEAAERQLTGRLRGIVDTAPDGIILIDAGGSILMFNPAAERLFGYAAGETVGRNVKMLMPPPYAGEHDRYLEEYRRTGLRKIIGIGRDVVGRRKNGTTFPMHLAVGEIHEDGRSIFAGIVHDLTERRKSEARVREMQTLLAGIVESSEQAIISKNLGGIVTTWNAGAERIFGYAAEEIIGRHISVLAVPGHEDDMTRILERIKRGERVHQYETRRRRKDGTIIDILLTVSPIRDANGALIGASKMVSDISAMKMAEAALTKNREHLARAQELGQMGSVEVDLATGVAVWSEGMYRLHGLDPAGPAPSFEDVVAMTHPDDRAALRELDRKSRAGIDVDPWTFRVIRPDGGTLWLLRQIRTYRDAAGKATSLLITNLDVTLIKEADAARRRSEEHLARVQRVSKIASAEIDLRTREGFWSDELYRMMGLEPGSVPPKPEQFFARIHPEDQGLLRSAMERGLRGERIEPLEFRIPQADGTVRWLYRQSDYVRDDRGSPISYIATYVDITPRKEAEERRAHLEEQLRQSQKMDAVGQLTGGVAHDFNNLLAIILGNLELVRERVTADAKMQRQLDAAIAAGNRGAELTQRLLAFSRRQPLEPVSLDVNKKIGELMPLLHRTLGETIEVSHQVAPGIWRVIVDPSQFDSAIVNLSVNSRDAMPDGGTLAIRTENVAVDAAYAAQRPGLATGRYVRVSISDTGAGMPPEVVAKAFEPFFTTKEVGKGTGLGLSMVFGFVKQSGGHVGIYSEVGEGTTVTMLLPADPNERVEEQRARAPSAERGGAETVLVVEDDPAVRQVTVSFLESLGYVTLEAGTAAEGGRVLDANPRVDALLTDVILPGGADGAAMARRAKESHPDLKVLFMSGYTQDVVMRNGRLEEGVVLLRKPFTRRQLADKLRAVIDGTDAGE